MKTFTYMASVKGGLISSFVFEKKKDLEGWIKTVLPELIKEYGELKLYTRKIEPLKVGDRCHVYGEGNDVFVIEGLKKYSENRYGFILDSGWAEEVCKCYPVK